MMDLQKFLTAADLEESTLCAWVTVGWLTPQQSTSGWIFSVSDLARVRLLADLAGEFGLNHDSVTAILGLLGQIEALRRTLRPLLSIARSLPEPLRRRIAVEILDDPYECDVIQEPALARHSDELRREIRL